MVETSTKTLTYHGVIKGPRYLVEATLLALLLPTTCLLKGQHMMRLTEFLGNLSGDPYIVHTNVFTQGKGNREQQFYLWFDPTRNFHTYSIVWTSQQIIFLVDNTPIRVFKNGESIGVPFPKNQPMQIYSSLWNADDWATRGGLVKADWTKAPFTAYYRGFNVQTCTGSCTPCLCDCPPPFSLLKIAPGLANLSVTDCGGDDPDLKEETEKQFVDLLTEEMKLQETVNEEHAHHMNITFAEARRVASQYQREAEKCNAATETCAQVCHLVKANKFTLSLSHLSTFKPTILFLINSLPHFL
ncbi:hypothetical protein CsSME_00028800 [Camellia sinensis var. sinensis]